MLVNLPYFGPKSVEMKKELTSLFKKYLVDFNVTTVFSNSFSLSSFFNYKDKLPNAMRSCVVYKYSCASCDASGVYFGSTLRRLHTRVSEHAGVSPRTGAPLTSAPQSSIRDHAAVCGSPVDRNNFSIIGMSKNPTNLRILESLHIYKSKPDLNNTLSAYPLLLVNK